VQRFVPHPNKLAIPVMALSHGGVGIGLAWNQRQHATCWFNNPDIARNLRSPRQILLTAARTVCSD
jgi:hypothetical protein